MKPAVKLFLFQLLVTFFGALTLTIFISKGMEGVNDWSGDDLLRGSMTLGGLGSAWLLAAYGGWKRLTLKSVLWVGGIISGFFSGNPVTVIVGLIVAVLFYLVASKARDYLIYHRSR